MANYFEKKDKLRREQQKYYRTRTNRRLKYGSFASIGIAIILIVAQIFLMDSLSHKMMMFMRGCAGLFALIYVILVAILVYRVNAAHMTDKFRTGRDIRHD